MAKKGCASGCLKLLIVMVFCAVLLGAGGYLGGNFLLKKYIGDEGELMALGINNWQELFDAFNGLKGLTDSEPPEVNAADTPTDANKTSADEKLNNNIEGYDSDKGLFGGGELVFNGKLSLTGGELAAIMESERTKEGGVADIVPFEFNVYAVTLNSRTAEGGTEYEFSDIAIIIAIDSSVVKGMLEGSGVPGVGLLTGGLGSGKMYISMSNALKSEDGQVALAAGAQKNVVLNNGGVTNDKILNIILSVAGTDKEALADNFATALAGVLNGIGKVTFNKDADISVVEFDNKYNNQLIDDLGFFAGVDLAADYTAVADDLAAIKNTVGQIRAILAKRELGEDEVAGVTDAVADLVQKWEAFEIPTYEDEDSGTHDTVALKASADALLDMLDTDG